LTLRPSINTGGACFVSRDDGRTFELDAIEEFTDFLRYAGSPDVAASGGLSRINTCCLDPPATFEQFASDDDVSFALRDASVSSPRSFSPPEDSLPLLPNPPMRSNTIYYNRVDTSLPLVVTSFKCLHAQCGELFQSEVACSKHCAIKHPAKPYNCGLLDCDKSFRDKRSLRRHLATTSKHRTSSTPAYTCRCGAIRPRWDQFTKHIRCCASEKTRLSAYTCYCGQAFQDVATLEEHKSSSSLHPDMRGRPRKRRELPGKDNV